MKRPFLTLLLVLTFAQAFAQLPQRFEGLARTRVQWLVDGHLGLTNEPGAETPALVLPPAESLTVCLDRLRQELINLPAITRASYRIDSAAGKPAAVTWSVEESRTVFPLLNLGGVKDNFYYLVGFTDLHFRGRGQQLTAFYQNNDGEHNYFVGLTNPSYKGSRWGYQVDSRRYAAIEPLYFPAATVSYRYANLNFGAGVSYTTPNRNVFRFGVSTFNERYRKNNAEPGSPGPDEVALNKGLLRLNHDIQRIDYFSERLTGTHHATTVQYVRDFNNQSDFLIGWHDFRIYRLVGQKGNLAARLRTGLSTNDNSPFAPFVLDSQFNIRGSGNRIDRGTAQLVLNLEYRHTAWRDVRHRFAAQLVAFSDLGTWRNPGGELSDLVDEGNFRHFVGGGVRLISLKAFNALIRVDYGVDVRNARARGVVVGFGQYF